MNGPRLNATTRKLCGRVLRTIESRVAVTGEVLSPRLIPSQMVLRSVTLARGTMQAETSALRFLLRDMAEGHMDTPAFRALAGDFPWLRAGSRAEVAEALRLAERPIGSLGAETGDVVARLRAGGRGMDLSGLSDEEICRQVSGVRRERISAVRNKGSSSLLRPDYLRIMMDLSEHDMVAATRAYVQEDRVTDGVVAVMLGALYLFGMRPVEIWQSSVMVPDTQKAWTADMREMTRHAPLRALDKGYLVPIGPEILRRRRDPGQVIVDAQRATGATACLVIRQAKQTNANPELKVPIRLLLLDAITRRDARIAGCAVLLGLAGNDAPRRSRLTRAATAVLRTVLSRHPDMRQDVTLYSFRHSFVTRTRHALDAASAAALTGHTSPATLGGYGERTRAKGGGWMPQPDPERAATLRLAFDLAHRMQPVEPGLDSSLEDGQADFDGVEDDWDDPSQEAPETLATEKENGGLAPDDDPWHKPGSEP